MKLSMIIISYNEAEYLPEAIDSCLNQKVDFDFEIIVGDDGSTDGSINIIEEYEKQYPSIIKHFVMERNVNEEIVTLDKPNEGLYVSNVMWREMFDFSPDAVLLVLASELYDESDYIRNYDDFLKYVGADK